MSNTAKNIRVACPHCGAVLETDGQIENVRVECPACGVEFEPQPAAAVQRKRSKGGKQRLWIVLAVLFVVFGSASALFFASHRAESITGKRELGPSLADRAPSPSPHPGRIGKNDTPAVPPRLAMRTVDGFCKQFGGRVSADAYSFATGTGNVDRFLGNPIFFLQKLRPSWFHYQVRPGEGHVFVRDDRFILTDDPHCAELRQDLCRAVGVSAILLGVDYKKLGGGRGVDSAAGLWVTNLLRKSSRFPAPVVFSYEYPASRFLYLNDSGNPSALVWGVETNDWFWCHEGVDSLVGYADTLRQLRDKLVEYTQIAKEEGLTEYKKNIPLKNPPEIYIGQLDAGTREKAKVKYEFCVDRIGNDVVYRIKEIAETGNQVCSHTMGLTGLEEESDFFGHFETQRAVEDAFAPLHAFLTHRCNLSEQAAREAERLARRFDGAGDTGRPKGASGPETEERKQTDDPPKGTDSGKPSAPQAPKRQQAVAVPEKREHKEQPQPRQQAVAPPEKRIPKEFVPLAAAVAAAKSEGTAENFGKMETAWKALPERQKTLAQKSVLWASCAMLLAKGHPEAVAKRKAYVDTHELIQAVTESCHGCGGTGHVQEKCRECAGSGRCPFCRGSGHTSGLNGRQGTCPKCNSSGRCPACSGGTREAKCRSCGGSGRTLSEAKCRQVVDENLDRALRICRGEE